MALCTRCENFNIQSFSPDGFPYRSYPVASFIRAARAGCSFCSMLLEHFLAADRGDTLKFLSIELRKHSGEWADIKWLSAQGLTLFRLWLTTVRAPVWVHFRAKTGLVLPSRGTEALNIAGLDAFVSPFCESRDQTSACTHAVTLHLGADAGTPAATSQDITGRISLEKHTWGPFHSEAVSAWHRHCKANHRKCGQTFSRTESFDVDDVPLPSRCVELVYSDGVPDAAAPHPPLGFLLRETAGMRGRYIALSHRWGDDTGATQTTRSNYASRLLQCHQPTRLALEAAQHARSLGVRYLWIDSWCIVQDDEADWARESARMADYYQHAWLTISATALLPDGGLVGVVPPEFRPALARMPYRGRDGTRQGYFYAQCIGEEKLARDYVQCVSRSPLLRRGWVFQEWLLSRRLLAFSEAGVFVQCQEGRPKGLSGDNVNRPAALGALGTGMAGEEPEGFNDLAFKSALGIDLTTRSSVMASWLTVVETYSRLEVTRLEEDRLIALGGVAKEFGAALSEREEAAAAGRGALPGRRHRNAPGRGYRYVSGLWFGNLRGLAWEQVTPGPRVRLQGLPTWSWASMATAMDNNKGGEVLVGMEVQWSKPARRRDKPVAVCKMVQARTVPVAVSVEGDGQTVRTPLFTQATEEPPNDEYSKEHRFVMIRMEGRLTPVLIHGTFGSKGDRAVAGALTNHNSDFTRDMWRRATTESEPNVVVGWASIEHPDWQNGDGQGNAPHPDGGPAQQSTWSGQAAHALFLARISTESGGLGYGNLNGRQVVFVVLFLRPVDIPGFGTCYERLGTGRLFGNDIDAAFQELRGAERRIWLV